MYDQHQKKELPIAEDKAVLSWENKDRHLEIRSSKKSLMLLCTKTQEVTQKNKICVVPTVNLLINRLQIE
jgi:hypothetical protein